MAGTGLGTFGPAFKAGGNIATSVFVKISTAADETVLVCASGDDPFGISQEGAHDPPGLAGSDGNAAAAGQDIKVYGPGSHSPMINVGAGGVTRGDYLKPDNSGFAVTASTGDKCGAIALESGSANDRIKAYVWKGKAP
jgi:hypothetical protein